MEDKEINELSERLAKAISKRVAVGIKDKTLLAVEIKYIVKSYMEDICQDHKKGD